MPDKTFIPTIFDNGITAPTITTCDPAGEFLRVVTCYQDGKSYLFTIDVDNQVQHEVWQMDRITGRARQPSLKGPASGRIPLGTPAYLVLPFKSAAG